MLLKLEAESVNEITASAVPLPKGSKVFIVEYLSGCMRFKTHED